MGTDGLIVPAVQKRMERIFVFVWCGVTTQKLDGSLRFF